MKYLSKRFLFIEHVPIYFDSMFENFEYCFHHCIILTLNSVHHIQIMQK